MTAEENDKYNLPCRLGKKILCVQYPDDSSCCCDPCDDCDFIIETNEDSQ